MDEARWGQLMERVDSIDHTVNKIESKIEKRHEEIFSRMRTSELELALLRQRVYFISAGISGGIGAVIAGAVKIFGW